MKKRIISALMICALILCNSGVLALPVSAKTKDKKGKVTEDTYQNEYFGFKVTLEEGWSFDVPEEEKEAKEESAGKNIDLLNLENNDAAASIRITYAVKDETGNLTAEALVEQLVPSLEKRYKENGAEISDIEQSDVQFLDKDVKETTMKIKISGQEAYQQFLFIEYDKDILSFITTVSSKKDIEEGLKQIEPIKKKTKK